MRRALPASALAIALAAAGCGSGLAPPGFDTGSYLRGQYADRLGPAEAAQVEVPFELDAELLELIDTRFAAAGSQKARVDQILDFVFRGLGLNYTLVPTRNAVETYRSRQGNCLSFVNLFVGVARHRRLNPFYVEVEDYQRWKYQDGSVVSAGHIVAGMYVDGELSTFDFLPYEPKSYRSFKPIDDLEAAAHYFNNLGAEALFDGDRERAEHYVRLAHRLNPQFDKAISNLGVVLMRRGEVDEAVEVLEAGLAIHPDHIPLLVNTARAYQLAGSTDAATRLFSRIDAVDHANPYFFIYRGEQALARGDRELALELMRKALRRDSENPEVHLGLTKVFLATGDLKRARHHLQRALRLDATHEEARRYAAMLEKEGG